MPNPFQPRVKFLYLEDIRISIGFLMFPGDIEMHLWTEMG